MNEEIANILDDIRKELRIANQLKFLEFRCRFQLFGLKDEEKSVYLNLRDKLVPSDDTIKQ